METLAGYQVHPYRNAIPPPTEEFLESLEASIRERGQDHPIVLDAQGRILDGRARAMVCERLGRSVATTTYQGDEFGVAEYVLDSVLIVRELTGAQRNLLAARLIEPVRSDARKRRTRAGKSVPQTVAEEEREKGEARDIIAKRVGKANREYVRLAEQFLTDRDLVRLIDSGRVGTIPEARRLSELRPDDKVRVVATIDAEPSVAVDDAIDGVVGERPKADDRWMTPRDIVAAVTAAFGGKIAFDPATEHMPTSPEGNPVGALAYCYEGGPTSGLDVPWPDRTWCNPPFSQASDWTNKALREYDDRGENGKRIYMLLPIRPDASHQRHLLRECVDVLLLGDRLKFGELKPDGTIVYNTAARNSHLIIGLGCSVQDLVTAGLEGLVVRPALERSEEAVEAERLARADGYEPNSDDTVTDEERVEATRQAAEDAAFYDALVKARPAVMQLRHKPKVRKRVAPQPPTAESRERTD